jgi:hypothetical protein
MRKSVRVALLATLVFCVPAVAQAQAWAYPAFQPPRVINREFNFAVADAGHAGTSLIFQWREGLTPRTQLSFDLGFADPDGNSNGKLLFGGQFAGLLTEAKQDLPLDFLLTGGLNFAVGDGSDLIRIPFGVSVGHRFPLDEGFAITPYVHPRLSLDICTDCAGRELNESSTDLGIDFDLGVNFEVTRSLSFRVSAQFGGSDAFNDSDGFGLSLAYAPAGLSRMIQRIGKR